MWARQELVLLLREPVAVFFSLVFPVIMYVFIGIPYGSTEIAPRRALRSTPCSPLFSSV